MGAECQLQEGKCYSHFLQSSKTHHIIQLPMPANWFHPFKSTFPRGSADIGQRRTGQPLGTPT